MSFFRKQTPTPAPTFPSDRDSEPAPAARAASAQQVQPLFNGPHVDIGAIYRDASLTPDDLDRVVRAEGLLHLLPSTASQTRDIVDATFNAFGVDRTRIVDAAGRQVDVLERFIRFSQEQTQQVLDATESRVGELEAEIQRCRDTAAQAKREGEERARIVNNEMVKVQRVLEFFGGEANATAELDLDDATAQPVVSSSSKVKPPTPPSQAGQTAKPPHGQNG